jgi:soluble lytic murein transglycosylase-like protein
MKHNQRFAQQVTRVAGKAMVILSAAVAFLVPSTVTDILIEQKVILPRQVQVIAEALAEGAADASHTTSTAELERAVTRAAQQHHVHPALLFAVMKAESSFNPLVVSKAGAVGLMQLVPETAMRHGVRNLYDMTENVAGGAKHLRYLLDRFHGNTRLALAAYNAGERKVDRYRQIPPYKETRHYVQKVLSYYRDYRKETQLVPLGNDQLKEYRVRTL